jgi:hypothetical protein
MMTNSLPVPHPADTDSHSIEVASIWISNNNQYISIRQDVWDDPAAWGLLLCDVINHVSKMYANSGKGDFSIIRTRIKLGLDVEFSTPST